VTDDTNVLDYEVSDADKARDRMLSRLGFWAGTVNHAIFLMQRGDSTEAVQAHLDKWAAMLAPKGS